MSGVDGHTVCRIRAFGRQMRACRSDGMAVLFEYGVHGQAVRVGRGAIVGCGKAVACRCALTMGW